MAADANVWAPVAAALGASGLTLLGTWGLQRRRDRREAAAGVAERRRAAYVALLGASLRLVFETSALRANAELRSGFTESLDVVTRIRKAPDLFDVSDRLLAHLGPLVDAAGQLMIVGGPQAVDIANRMVAVAGALVGIPVGPQGQGKFAALIRGVRATDEQVKAYSEHVFRLGELRRALAALARREAGIEDVDLLSGVDEVMPTGSAAPPIPPEAATAPPARGRSGT